MGLIRLAPTRSFVFPYENPVTGDDHVRHQMLAPFHVKEIVALKMSGTGTFDWELRYSPNANDQGVGTLLHSDTAVSNETTGEVYLPPFTAGPDPLIIPAGNWVWLEVPATSTGTSRLVALSVIMKGIDR